MQTGSICSIPGIFFSDRDSGERVKDLLSLLERTRRDSPAAREVQTLIQLEGVLKLSYSQIPAYRSHLAPWKPGEELTWERFRELPILTRSALQDAGEGFNNPQPPPAFQPTGKSTTSGSTGKPLITQGHRAAGLLSRALQLRFQKFHGFNFDAICAFITSPQPGGRAAPPLGAAGPAWGAPYGEGSSRLTDLMADTSAQLDFILQLRPKYLATYPSNLQALLKCSQERGKRPQGLDAIVLSSEPLSEELMALSRAEWGAECVGTYSASEVGLMAAGIPGGGGYHIQSEAVYLEVLDDDGRPCQPGEIGRVVVTTLQEFLRPLIRYEVGDYAEVGHPDPKDPVTLPRLRRIVGRERTMIQLPDGRRIWPYFEFASLVALGGIRQWQLVQKKDLTMEVRVVPMGELTQELALAVSKVVKDSLPGVDVRVEAVSEIQRSPRGKYLELVSEVEG